MGRKRFSENNGNRIKEMRFTKLSFLQDTEALKEAQFKDLKMREKRWVKEDICEECGAFDILSRYKGKFLCSECLKLTSLNNKKHKKNIKH